MIRAWRLDDGWQFLLTMESRCSPGAVSDSGF
jgi:hypothetical protein